MRTLIILGLLAASACSNTDNVVSNDTAFDAAVEKERAQLRARESRSLGEMEQARVAALTRAENACQRVGYPWVSNDHGTYWCVRENGHRIPVDDVS